MIFKKLTGTNSALYRVEIPFLKVAIEVSSEDYGLLESPEKLSIKNSGEWKEIFKFKFFWPWF